MSQQRAAEISPAGQEREAPSPVEFAPERRYQIQGIPRLRRDPVIEQGAEGTAARPAVRECFDQLTQSVIARSFKTREFASEYPEL